MRIGFIGLGAMGLPMAGHLLAAGHEVTVASRSRGPIDAAVALGASDGGSPRGVAEASEVVILCVPNSPEVVEVVDDMLPALGAGQDGGRLLDHRPRGGAGPARAGARDRARATSTPRSRAARPGAHKGALTLMVGGDAATLADGRAGPRPLLRPDRPRRWARAWARWSSCATT